MEEAMKRLVGMVLIVFAVGCAAPNKQTSATEEADVDAMLKEVSRLEHGQRFLPLNAESSKTGVPWSGFFALDTETGQLCRTTAYQFNNRFDQLPLCFALANPTAHPNK